MVIGVFYCYQIPIADLKSIDWLIAIPVRDWELEEALGQPIWMVRYKADHPDMQNFNRLQTCRKCRFSDVVFEDDVVDTFEVEGQDPTEFMNKSVEVGVVKPLKAIGNYIISLIRDWYKKKNRKREKNWLYLERL